MVDDLFDKMYVSSLHKATLHVNQDSLNTLFSRLLAKAKADPDLADLLRQQATHTLDALRPAGDTKPSKGAPPAAAAELASAPKTPNVVQSPTPQPI